jgi:hypothetical protein
MNYFLAYQRLIDKAKARVCVDGYVERHHVLPRALGGSDDSSNLVALTAREHFVAHVLLAKIHGGILWQAVILMSGGKNRYCNSRLFEMARCYAFVEREKFIKAKRIANPSFDAYMHKIRSDATKNRVEGYQAQVGQKFRERFASDAVYAEAISKNRVKAQQASAAATRIKSATKAEKVLTLRAAGKKYSEIMQEVDCSIGFVSKVVSHASVS